MSDKERGFLSKLTWREYFLIGGLLIIWATVVFAAYNASTIGDTATGGFAAFMGVVATGGLLILIAIIDRIF